ncbi:hypothetical protein A3J44_06985 [candidate division WOR-1 bacterium RIFCSPHIGHO2_02_FULL_45_12]|nr:MAG: hypothetical protein A3J44_06985 [candidate division WOR-1 bacterium RIFCSPHIGHO2_02_FULL_45_12]
MFAGIQGFSSFQLTLLRCCELKSSGIHARRIASRGNYGKGFDSVVHKYQFSLQLYITIKM